MGRCESGFDAQKACQCDSMCKYYKSCCSDFEVTCGRTSKTPPARLIQIFSSVKNMQGKTLADVPFLSPQLVETRLCLQKMMIMTSYPKVPPHPPGVQHSPSWSPLPGPSQTSVTNYNIQKPHWKWPNPFCRASPDR